ncbi:hypothetical protein F0L74_26925 [Chitinophaga agrisoli]|uniref:Uncharacterized protein n=1 Tax=Chitinophaga agrisoli TaxID=2607653 RepID=A0A5B2VJQ5_9BACT|nr:hypothetical protein [Chitinophaga agrisoli]KAA2239823.1 hypothetical protein F0L74_26925 [Chitinophaga agrisoli]
MKQLLFGALAAMLITACHKDAPVYPSSDGSFSVNGDSYRADHASWNTEGHYLLIENEPPMDIDSAGAADFLYNFVFIQMDDFQQGEYTAQPHRGNKGVFGEATVITDRLANSHNPEEVMYTGVKHGQLSITSDNDGGTYTIEYNLNFPNGVNVNGSYTGTVEQQ